MTSSSSEDDEFSELHSASKMLVQRGQGKFTCKENMNFQGLVFQHSWSSSESSFDRPRWQKQTKNHESLSVEVVASGVTFLMPVQSPLIRGLGVKRSKIVLPNVDPKALARLIQHLMHGKTPLNIQNKECISLLRLAMVFNMEDIFQKGRNHVFTIINGQGGQLAGFGPVVSSRLNSQSMVDDAFLVTLDGVLASLPDIQHLDHEKTVQQPLQGARRSALTPLSQCHSRQLTFPPMYVQEAQTPQDPTKARRPKFNIFELLIRPRKMSKKRGALSMTQNSKKAGAVPVSQNYKKPDARNYKKYYDVPASQNSVNSKKPAKPGLLPSTQSSKKPANVKGEDNPTPVKKNPLALSVIRKIPRTKPH